MLSLFLELNLYRDLFLFNQEQLLQQHLALSTVAMTMVFLVAKCLKDTHNDHCQVHTFILAYH